MLKSTSFTSYFIAILLTICAFVASPSSATAGKISYTMTITSVSVNGEEIKLDAPVRLAGEFKKQSERLPVVKVGDQTLCVEIIVATEGTPGSKQRVVNQKYYYKNKKGKYRLLSVTRRLLFTGEHKYKGTYTYNDPANSESLSVTYSISVVE
jgi:hypothetical protein